MNEPPGAIESLQFRAMVMCGNDCPKSEVIAAIVGSPSFSRLHDEWKSLGRHLGLPDDKIKRLEDDYILRVRIKSLEQLLNELLSTWKAEKGDEAKIIDLCNGLENCGLKDIAQALSSEFGNVSCSQKAKFIWQGKLVTREDLLGKETSSELNELDKKRRKLSERRGTPIIRPQLSPPAKPKYYIPRTLSYLPSSELDPAILVSDSTKGHVFLINDITKPELAKLTNYQAIEFSGDQLHSVNVRFILLECDEDFNRICKNTTQPVHVIQHKAPQQYFWVKSSAALDAIRPFLKEPPKYISELELAECIMSSTSLRTLSIADSPGMGKTLVLANLAAKIQERSSSNTIHLFFVLQEFTQHVKSHLSAVEAIAAYSSSDRVTRNVLAEMIKKSYCHVYLFLDGYDEVLYDKDDAIDSFLKQVQKLTNVKTIVTTRPHLRTRLEVMFNEFSYEIRPFNEKNQVKFLISYWVNQHGAENCEKLKQFANICLSQLKTNLSDKERKITGIPLQCMMLAEVYATTAQRASQVKTERVNKVQPVAFIEMYKKLVQLKFARVPLESSRQNYVHAHVYEAIKLLFPDWIDVFRPILRGYDDINKATLYSIGLVEHSPSTPRFVHRTFAEYLLAEFVVNNLGTCVVCMELLFAEIIGWKGIVLDYDDDEEYCDGLKIYREKYPVIVYFVDLLLKNRSMEDFFLPISVKDEILKVEDFCIAITACGSNGHERTFDYATNVLRRHHFCVSDATMDKYFKNLLHEVVWRCNDVKLLGKVLEFTNEQCRVDLSHHVIKSFDFGSVVINKCTPLHLAVHKGKYNVVTWLVQQYGNHINKLKHLLHACVYNSAMNDDPVVDDKLLIIDMLVAINRDWVQEINEYDDSTPLLQYCVHLNLLQRLIHHGADINACSRHSETVLHRSMIDNTFKGLLRWAYSIKRVPTNQPNRQQQ